MGGDSTLDTAEYLRRFFERLRDEGPKPALLLYINALQDSGELNAEAAELLCAGDREEIERLLEASRGARPFVFWPPGGW